MENDAAVFDHYERLVSGLQALPGVKSVTASAMPVLAHAEWAESVLPDGSGTARDAYIQSVRWNFFETMGIPLSSGRGLSRGDSSKAPRVAVINDTMAAQIFGDRHPIGRHFRFLTGRDRNVAIEVVGVVRDSKYSRLEQDAPPTVYLPHRQVPPGPMTFEVRTWTDPAAMMPLIRTELRRLDSRVAPIDLKTQRQQIAETIATPRGLAWLTGGFSVAGLVLACVGLYGMVSFDVARRTHEIGVRMAIGAERGDVIRLVLRETMIVVAIGSVAGVLLAVAAGRLVGHFLFGIEPGDPLSIGAAIFLLAGATALAGYLPARRASRLDPTEALRYE
jgi:predicted permease